MIMKFKVAAKITGITGEVLPVLPNDIPIVHLPYAFELAQQFLTIPRCESVTITKDGLLDNDR